MAEIPTIYIFCHGVANHATRQIADYTQSEANKPYLFAKNDLVIGFNFPDAVLLPIKLIKPWQASLGQENEMEALKKCYDLLITIFENMGIAKFNIVIVGVSRGATVALNFLALHAPKHITALIVESPFGHAKDLGNESLLKLGFWRYNRNGIAAINVIQSISKEIPVLFVCSRKDQRVPYSSTMSLYSKLKKDGHKKLHLYVADHAKHYDILSNKNLSVGKKYQQVVQRFLLYYGILNAKNKQINRSNQPNIKSQNIESLHKMFCTYFNIK